MNAVCFIDDGRSFVTSSDDKKLMIWEFGIPVVKKPISEPHMHSMPFLAETKPDGEFFLAQSMDNQVCSLFFVAFLGCRFALFFYNSCCCCLPFFKTNTTLNRIIRS